MHSVKWRDRSALTAFASTTVVFVALGILVVRSPGWHSVRRAFFQLKHARASLPDIAHGFLLNVRLFLVAEVCVLAIGLTVAIVRNIPGPTMLPFRILATAYTDVFRGVPTILLIYLFGFGVPALGIDRPWNSPLLWGSVALIANYGAYDAEVFRSGIRSVHPSQLAAARSLGLSQWKAFRFVVVPQAIRRVIPPLLNDFISLQKDTALVSMLGPLEALRNADIYAKSKFNYTPYVVASCMFLLLTIPMSRFVDWLILRQERARR